MASPSASRALPIALVDGPAAARPGIAGLGLDELAAWLAARGEPGYRARQIADAVWRGTERSFEEIRTLPAPLRAALEDAFRFDTVAETDVRLSDAGLTEKS